MTTVTAPVVDVSLLLERGRQLAEHERQVKEQARQRAEAERREALRAAWEPHYQALADMGLGELIPCAPLPEANPVYHYSNTYGSTTYCNPLMISVPGVGPVAFYYSRTNGWGFFAAPERQQYEDEDGNTRVRLVTDEVPIGALQFKTPTLDSFARALFEAAEIAKQHELTPA